MGAGNQASGAGGSNQAAGELRATRRKGSAIRLGPGSAAVADELVLCGWLFYIDNERGAIYVC